MGSSCSCLAFDDDVPDPGAAIPAYQPQSQPAIASGPQRSSQITVPRQSIDDFKEATGNFAPGNMLGEGSFGRVYQGSLNGRTVAVKKLEASSQPDNEFLEGVATVSQLQHANVTQMIAFCADGPQRALVFEYATHGSVHDILHGRKVPRKTDDPPITLTWHQRVKIALGAAKGLEYLHEKANPSLVHKSVKSANVLVFEGFEGKIADFNVANEAPDQGSRMVSTRVLGTFGYNAPEYATLGRLTQKSDVYSFGVVLLELLTGRKPVDPNMPRGQQSLVTWATQGRLAEDRVKSCVDPKLKGNFPEKSVAKFAALAALCVQYDGDFRPSMSIVMFVSSILRASAQYKFDSLPTQDAPIKDKSWHFGSATFYGNDMLVGNSGNCGYPYSFVNNRTQVAVPDPRWSNTLTSGIGNFKGAACGQCFMVKCLSKPRYAGKVFCRSKKAVMVTITNFDTPRSEGWPNNHFDFHRTGFEKIADPDSGIVNVMWRRTRCPKTAPKYTVKGNPYWHDITVYDVPGVGAITGVWVKRAGRSDWEAARHSWGAHWVVTGKVDWDSSKTKVRAQVAESRRFIYPARKQAY
ncbi:unnamed protein product [Closterium sp. NIES-64]|nr:unnamed protein product [Closterium sp. NIES-64]